MHFRSISVSLVNPVLLPVQIELVHAEEDPQIFTESAVRFPAQACPQDAVP